MSTGVNRSVAPTQLSNTFKEKRNDIDLFLTKYNDYFESSANKDLDIIEKTTKVNQSLVSYKEELTKKLTGYNEKLAEFQNFIDGFIKKK
jgi:hypothetical protein